MVAESEAPVPPIAKTRLGRSRRQVYLQIVAAIVILACGVVIGSGAALLHFKPNIVPDRVPPPRDIVEDMRGRYDLTEEQAEKAEKAVKDSSERMRTIFTGIREKMDAEFKTLSAEMKDIFTAEQFKRWERDFRAMRSRRPGRFGPGRPGPGGPGPGGHRPLGWRGGPGGGRGGRRPDPNSRREYEGLRPRTRGPAEPNSPEQ